MDITFDVALEGIFAIGQVVGNPALAGKIVKVLRKKVAAMQAEGKHKKAEKFQAGAAQGYAGLIASYGAAVYAKFGVVLPGYVRTATRPPSVAPAPRQPSVIPAPRMPSVPPATPGMPSADAIADAVRVLRPYVAEFLASRRAA